MNIQDNLKRYFPVIPAIAIYALFCYLLNFTQDDAYISYRYVANFLNGDGLVFNIGERVEGYTNFGWVIYLILWGKLGLDYILISKVTGFIFGAGLVVLSFKIAESVDEFKDNIIALYAVPFLVAINQSLAYWSIAGLETSAFAFFALLTLYFYFKRSKLTFLTIFTAVLLRPEGALVAFLIIVLELIEKRNIPKYSLFHALIAFVLSIPYVVFKLVYYGSILPNSFYAKTVFSVTQLMNGVEYVYRFLGHYGFYGFPIAVLLIFITKISSKLRLLLIFVLIYTLYILFVGGDVLKVHRFFIPLIPLYSVIALSALVVLIKDVASKTRMLFITVVALVLCGLTYYLPDKFVKDYNALEKAFVKKMSFMAENLKSSDDSDFSVALPTIGVFGYTLVGHHIIDMVGLTDSTIARHSEAPIEGMETTWKEAKHNSGYILNFAPDYIMFSTDVKPSAPAEKALMLYSRFLFSYNPIGWYNRTSKGVQSSVKVIFKRKDKLEGKVEPDYPLEFVDYYKLGLEEYSKNNYQKAIEYYDKALVVSPRPVYNVLLYEKGVSHLLLREFERAVKVFNLCIAQDSTFFMPQREMYINELVMENREKAMIHREYMKKAVPWLMPRVDSIAADILQKIADYKGK